METETTLGPDVATLEALNRHYIRAVQQSDAAWFDRTLAEDFRCSLPDGSLLDRAQFLARAARPAEISQLEVHDVEVRLFGDTAVIHARTTFVLPDGRRGSGRYTDVWCRLGGQWVVVAAHFTRSAA